MIFAPLLNLTPPGHPHDLSLPAHPFDPSSLGFLVHWLYYSMGGPALPRWGSDDPSADLSLLYRPPPAVDHDGGGRWGQPWVGGGVRGSVSTFWWIHPLPHHPWGAGPHLRLAVTAGGSFLGEGLGPPLLCRCPSIDFAFVPQTRIEQALSSCLASRRLD